MRFIRQPNPYEWYFLRARDQTSALMTRVLAAYRDVVHEYIHQPSCFDLAYGDDEEIDMHTDVFNDFREILKITYGLYKAHNKDWEFECLFNDALRIEIESFL